MKTCHAIEHDERCTLPVFSHSFCKFHQHWREDKKPKQIQKMKPSYAKKKKETLDKDRVFYMSIWNERTHHCFECLASKTERSFLGSEPKSYMFDHILEKGEARFAHLRHEKRNIQLICLTHHSSKTSGFISPFQKMLKESTIRHFEDKGLLPKLHEQEEQK